MRPARARARLGVLAKSGREWIAEQREHRVRPWPNEEEGRRWVAGQGVPTRSTWEASNDRLGRSQLAGRVGVAMDESPLAVLAPKDRGHAQADIVHDVATANATTQVLDLEEIPRSSE